MVNIDPTLIITLWHRGLCVCVCLCVVQVVRRINYRLRSYRMVIYKYPSDRKAEPTLERKAMKQPSRILRGRDEPDRQQDSSRSVDGTTAGTWCEV